MVQTEILIRRLDIIDDQAFKLGDTIDVKASIGLVVITFLATQSASFLAVNEPGRWLQMVSAFALSIAGVFALCELWPRTYAIEAAEAMDGWIKDLRDYYKDEKNADALIEAAMSDGHILRAKERIERNAAINKQKSMLLGWSFRFTALALVLNLSTLLIRAF
jgi:hypothetical protein